MKSLLCFSLWLCLAGAVCAQSNPVPFVDNPLVPTSAAPGDPAFTLNVNGANFVPGSVVMWNGHPRATHFVSKGRLAASISASDVATAATASVTVHNPGVTSSNSAFFSVVAPVASVAFTGSTFPSFGDPQSVVTADFNNDGQLDLALANATNLAIFLGNGDGTFQPVSAHQANYEPEFITSGDFNGDGFVDLAITSTYNTYVSVLLGKGDGTFHLPVSYPTNTNPEQVFSADFNRDGKLDLVVVSPYGASILLGNGDGTFQPQTTLATSGWAVSLADFNGDGIVDLAITTDSTLRVSLGNGDGTFQPYLEYPITSGLAFTIASGDLNGDGIPDVVAGTDTGVAVLLGNGDGSFGPPSFYVTTSSGFNIPAISDLNGDGKPDLVVLGPTGPVGDTVFVFLGNGDGTFQGPADFSGGYFPTNLAFADFNNDGAMDFAIAAFGFGGTTAGAFVSLQTNGPAVLLSSFRLSFPLQTFETRSKPEKFTLSNVGKQPLVIGQIAMQGADPNDFSQRNTCGSSVAAGSDCTIVVNFDPTFKGSRSATLVITDNALASKQSVDLLGTATWITLSPATLDFGDQRVGTLSPPLTLKVTNVGTGSVNVTEVDITSNLSWQVGEYSETNNCGTLAAGASCSVSVTFAPTLKGKADKVKLFVHHNGGVNAQSISLAGNGT